MGPLNAAVDDVEWIPVEDSSAVGAVRRATASLAARLGFEPGRIAEIEIAATELASNAHRHGIASSVLVRSRHAGAASTVEVVAIDVGPGHPDIDSLFDDGVSTAGTLGVGLGALRRLANRVDVHSLLGRGTVLAAVFADRQSMHVDVPMIDGITRPIRGEVVCGDSWASAVDAGRLALVVTDGLGHGPLAEKASDEIIAEFQRDPWRTPAEFIEAAHRRANGTRGAAVSAMTVDVTAGVVRFAGVGNVVGRIVGLATPSGLIPQPGIVGQQMRSVREVSVPIAAGCLLIVHSDGLTSKWDLDQLAGVTRHTPDVIAGVLLREAGRTDDAVVVVMRVPT